MNIFQNQKYSHRIINAPLLIFQVVVWRVDYSCRVAMPSKQRFCWCFGGRPPEITYGIESGEPLKAMTVEVPMPTDQKEIDEKFAEIVVSTSSKFKIKSGGGPMPTDQ